MPIRAQMSSIMGQIEPEHPELLTLEFGKIAESVYTLASTNINQSAPNLVKIDYGSNRTKTELSALEFENLPYLTLFTL